MTKKRSIPISFKREVIDYVEKNHCSAHRAWRHFTNQGYDYGKACYYRWIKQKDKILLVGVTKRRVEGGGKPPLLGEMENML